MLEKRLHVEYLKRLVGMPSDKIERFKGCEHEDLADNIKLKFYGRGNKPHSSNANEKLLKIKKFNGQDHNTTVKHPLTFGKINALAGDFFGIPDQPITIPGIQCIPINV